ncbi:DsbA family protein [Chelatococcus composti]|jgi:protein-disulfide isomerase|uniref:Protein-disulfide isomerase n=1 Tax=Chelatococcus composti TaxID=1743235 RepID=A0A841K4C0_9HYPH|nr:DsbA family protein [Chelatococcus composti]MBB6167367.1 protein-disulfide isomerase [Chelatococcus composti]MBS7735573.1 DsbA family protein [Chelatococcus composti]PZN43505.1 MAG: disulfide bond formation protein DsbA [Pseudomonadota bacterium]GGG31380.1 hypothetical protein GCM10008026_09850 [Chelatococcus composti]
MFQPSRRIIVKGLAGTFLAAGTPRALAAPVTAPHNRVPSELVNEIALLPIRVTVGSAQPDITIVEFFDYNCPWCRQSCRDAVTLLASEKDLAYVLVNYPILSEQSVEAARIALAFAQMRPAADYFALHQRIFALKGRVDAQRTFDIAATFPLDKQELLKRADSDEVTNAMGQAVALGSDLGFNATPSYTVMTEAFHGFVPLADKRAIIANLRACEAVTC